MDPYVDRLRLVPRKRSATVRWVREWVPQDVAATGGKCYLLKWVTEDMLKALKEKPKENEPEVQKPEPVTEMLFLCTYDGCGKTFAEVGALRKHTQVHGEKQYICPVEGCGKKFLDSSKLKRHNVIHTGERNHKCPYEGCGKAFSLDFNLRAHMKTHSLENYHFCPYPECGKKYTHECKLKTHIKTHHDEDVMMYKMPPPEKFHSARKLPVINSASLERPYVCPYAGCGKAYIHEYKLNLHLRKEHTSHNPVESYNASSAVEHKLHEGNDQDAQNVKNGVAKNKISKANVSRKMVPVKVANGRGLSPTPEVANDGQKKWPSKDLLEEDRVETEEDQEDLYENGWRYLDANRDDEETDDED